MGAGKSECSRILAGEGFTVIDVDTEAKKVMAENSLVREALRHEFGNAVDNRNIDFRILGSIVFNNDEKLRRLNGIVHPVVLRRIERLLSRWKGQTCIVVDAALIPMWSIDRWFDLLLWIHAPSEIRCARLAAKWPELSEVEIRRRMEMQERQFSPPSGAAWRHLDNSGDRSSLQESIRSCLQERNGSPAIPR
ncbi:MAG: dephospho-CoA kinase [Chitinispirillaceae bacterium]|nr:dephospho-CoA kinase [Chitinispirillaceae bacterium]